MSQPPGKSKRFVFWIILVLLTWLLAEGGVSLLYRIARGKPFPREAYQAELLATSQGDQEAPGSGEGAPNEPDNIFGDGVQVIHPYLGFGPNFTGQEFANYPMLGWEEELLVRREGRLVVGLFGGSFAGEMGTLAGDLLAAELAAATGKEVVLARFAYGGYKQPQHLLALTYLLSLGAEFDVIINLDGFNEVALAGPENLPKDVYPLYPRSWYFLAEPVNDTKTLELLGRLALVKEGRVQVAQIFQRSGLYASNLMLALWRVLDGRCAAQIVDLQLALQEAERAGRSDYGVTGPTVALGDAELYALLAAAWARGSREMRLISEAHGMAYYHFLQPNQYVEGSKPMGAEELAAAFEADHPYREGVVQGYPRLWEAGSALAAEGENFHDLTWFFAANGEALYRDSCCHLTEAGYRLVVAEMVRLMIEDGLR
jgi:hypothetical protein